MIFARRVFLLAGVVGSVFVLPMYFLEGPIGAQLPPPITHPEYFYGFVGVTLAWQILFLIIARDPIRLRPVMPVAVVEKISYGVAIPILFAAARVPGIVVAGALVDLLFALLFAAAYWKTPAA